ncbi:MULTISPECIES: hypothetical protein [Thiorhodovibrio]|uniref:hypothetical protein n=1 Tax=Thiorhodovibrio TaxID=61593 RepID=UPI00191389C3|nr:MULTISPECIES: hypothetical protein [Thiorhodovibrio]
MRNAIIALVSSIVITISFPIIANDNIDGMMSMTSHQTTSRIIDDELAQDNIIVASGDFGQCVAGCDSEQGICIGQCQGKGQCISNCQSAHGRCVARCH